MNFIIKYKSFEEHLNFGQYIVKKTIVSEFDMLTALQEFIKLNPDNPVISITESRY
jgi:hypothetical protein